MFKLDFNKNEKITLGVEVEIQLIYPVTGDLMPAGPAILDTLKKEKDSAHTKSEIFQSMLEIETPICSDAFEVGKSLRDSQSKVRRAAANHCARMIMAGTHPFAHYSERHLTPSGRYYSLVDRNKWITRRLQIFGLHVHLGMRDGDHAIEMNNALCHYLPLLLAISASSPYWHGEDTGLASCRITFFESIPTGGHPYLLKDWSEFESLIEKLLFSKSITSLKDLWWDIRPNTEFGTIEIRIADCPPTMKEIEALVALIHCLALFIDRELNAGRKFQPPPEWILRENKWRASRHGVQCDLIRDPNGTSVPLAEEWRTLCKNLDFTCEELGYKKFFNFIEDIIIRGPSYIRQRQHYHMGFDSIIRHLVSENERDQPDWRS